MEVSNIAKFVGNRSFYTFFFLKWCQQDTVTELKGNDIFHFETFVNKLIL